MPFFIIVVLGLMALAACVIPGAWKGILTIFGGLAFWAIVVTVACYFFVLHACGVAKDELGHAQAYIEESSKKYDAEHPEEARLKQLLQEEDIAREEEQAREAIRQIEKKKQETRKQLAAAEKRAALRQKH